MKIIACLAAVGMMTLPSSLLSTESDVADTHRFLIGEHGKYGFINSTGKVAIVDRAQTLRSR